MRGGVVFVQKRGGVEAFCDEGWVFGVVEFAS